MKPQQTRQATTGKAGAVAASEGVVVVDAGFKPVAVDTGAEAILNDLRGPGGDDISLPPEVLDLLAARSRNLQPDSTVIHLVSPRHEYSCRAFTIKPLVGGPGPFVAIHLKREVSVIDAVHQIGQEYHLTDREQEVLIGVSMGLTSKELAGRMNISPNTVKAFLRLIMIKMGVATRAGIVGKLLGQNGRPPDT